MSRAVDDERNWTRVPISELARPKSGICQVCLDYWWAVDDQDRAFFFRHGSPQCNSNKAIVERIKTHPDMVKVIQVPVAMWTINLRDYT